MKPMNIINILNEDDLRLSRVEQKLLNYISISRSFDTMNEIELYTTPKGNIQVDVNGKDLLTLDKSAFTDDEILELRDLGYYK